VIDIIHSCRSLFHSFGLTGPASSTHVIVHASDEIIDGLIAYSDEIRSLTKSTSFKIEKSSSSLDQSDSIWVAQQANLSCKVYVNLSPKLYHVDQVNNIKNALRKGITKKLEEREKLEEEFIKMKENESSLSRDIILSAK
jgi:hypothetical protein